MFVFVYEFCTHKKTIFLKTRGGGVKEKLLPFGELSCPFHQISANSFSLEESKIFGLGKGESYFLS